MRTKFLITTVNRSGVPNPQPRIILINTCLSSCGIPLPSWQTHISSDDAYCKFTRIASTHYYSEDIQKKGEVKQYEHSYTHIAYCYRPFSLSRTAVHSWRLRDDCHQLVDVCGFAEESCRSSSKEFLHDLERRRFKQYIQIIRIHVQDYTRYLSNK